MNCPLCGKQAKTERGLRKHLMGQRNYGGHNMSASEAEKTAREAARSAGSNTSIQIGTIFNTFLPTRRQEKSSSAETSIIELEKYTLSDNPFERFLHEMFNMMVQNKRLPKYQFERRVDAILNVFLPDILFALYGWNIDVIVPEFPLKSAHNNQSTNVDYLLFRHGTPKTPDAWVFFELKTDSLSVRIPQIDIYLTAMERGMSALYREAQQISRASKHQEKYAELLRRFNQYPLNLPIELVYLSPRREKTRNPKVHLISFQELQSIETNRYPEVWKLFRAVVLPVLAQA